MPETTTEQPDLVVPVPAGEEPPPIPTMIILEGTENAPVCENGVCL